MSRHAQETARLKVKRLAAVGACTRACVLGRATGLEVDGMWSWYSDLLVITPLFPAFWLPLLVSNRTKLILSFFVLSFPSFHWSNGSFLRVVSWCFGTGDVAGSTSGLFLIFFKTWLTAVDSVFILRQDSLIKICSISKLKGTSKSPQTASFPLFSRHKSEKSWWRWPVGKAANGIAVPLDTCHLDPPQNNDFLAQWARLRHVLVCFSVEKDTANMCFRL